MNPVIRKKDRDTKGNQRYVLEWEEDGKIKAWTFTAVKLLDYKKSLEMDK
jgi:hypothetical protein